MTRTKQIFVNLVVLLVTVLIMLVLVEIVLRVTNLAPGASVATATQKEFDTIPGIFSPGKSLLDKRNAQLPFQVDINSLGYRGPDFDIQKPAGETRILVVGDSYTFGDYVNNDETLPAQLEQQLSSQLASQINLTVINGGLSGSTVIGQRQMVKRAKPLSPDMVLLVHFGNDIEDMANPMWHTLTDNRRLKSTFPMSVVHATVGKTAMWNFALKMRFLLTRQNLNAAEIADDDQEAANKAQKLVELRSKYSAEISSLRDELQAANIKFAVAVYPSHLQMKEEPRREAIEWAVQMFEEAGIPTVDLLPSLAASGLSIDELHHLPIDGHPSAAGYAVAVKTIATELAPLLAD